MDAFVLSIARMISTIISTKTKSRIREILNLLPCAVSNTDTKEIKKKTQMSPLLRKQPQPQTLPLVIPPLRTVELFAKTPKKCVFENCIKSVQSFNKNCLPKPKYQQYALLPEVHQKVLFPRCEINSWNSWNFIFHIAGFIWQTWWSPGCPTNSFVTD